MRTWRFVCFAALWMSDVTAYVLNQMPLAAAPRSRPIAAEEPPLRIEVCMNKYCRKKGSKSTLELLEGLAADRDDVLVSAADMSHTEHGCFDECMMGPNVRVGGNGPKTDSPPGRILNGVKGEEAARALLP